ncbi:MAG: hypothetical protein OEX08_01460 [Candidatus Nomurabacteria bacterium]|nr:hypothetical protein [Candidatus Nomurabacteria bacterium]
MPEDMNILIGVVIAILFAWIVTGGIQRADRSGKFITPYDGAEGVEDLKVYDEKIFDRPIIRRN